MALYFCYVNALFVKFLRCGFCIFFFSSRRRHTRYIGDWSSDVCSSDLVAHRREQYGRLAPQSAASLEGAYFSVDLRSDALLRRGGWEPTTVLDAELLGVATGVEDPSLTLVRAYAEPEWRGGWQAAWGLPRPTELVARRGSCYLFRTTNLAAWTAVLEALEATGVGARTAEGYGEVRVCDPFHLVLREHAV